MKALIFITGRGLGGDAVIGLNLIKSLEKQGVDCELVLDHTAPGLLFKKNGYSWYKIKIPQAGGHAATKFTAFKAGLKMLQASLESRKLIKKVKPDFIVGINGGGAIVGCFSAKITRTPCVGVLSTPLDSFICPKLNPCIFFPESPFFTKEVIPKNTYKEYLPINPELVKGNSRDALERLKEYDIFDENKKTIVFSSGSSLFKGMVDGIVNFSDFTDEYNLLLTGLPLEDEYLDLIKDKNIIYLGYVDWIKDLFQYCDLAVLTDDGVMLHEAIATDIPLVALTKVKYGRYHNMAGIFKGAIIEAELHELNDKIIYSLNNLSEISKKAKEFSSDIINSGENVAKRILKLVK